MVQYILITEIDLLYGWAVLERRPNHVNKRVFADIWLLTVSEPWHGRWYENKIFIASCTDNIIDLENERWLLGDMIDHVGIYGSRVAEGLWAFNIGLVSNNFTGLSLILFKMSFYLLILFVITVIVLPETGPVNWYSVSIVDSDGLVIKRLGSTAIFILILCNINFLLI